MPSELLTERRETTLVLTISGPAHRNALSEQVYAASVEALATAESDPSVRAVVLRGDGEHFCAGGDIQRMSGRRAEPRERSEATLDRFHELIEALRTFPKPVIAAVEGAAAGGGFSLALGCDLIVAAEDARFVMSYARIGLTPDGGSSWHLIQALPRQKVAQLVWLAEPLSAAELQALGLVGWVVPRGLACAKALEVAARLASHAASNAIASGKELLRAWPPRELHEHLAAERQAFVDNLMHANAGEGLAAFLEKRTPRFE